MAGSKEGEGYQHDRDYVLMQQEIAKLSAFLEQEVERVGEKDRQLRQLDCENKALQISQEDDRCAASVF